MHGTWGFPRKQSKHLVKQIGKCLATQAGTQILILIC